MKPIEMNSVSFRREGNKQYDGHIFIVEVIGGQSD